MKSTSSALLGAISAAAVLAGSPALAHHSFAMFDRNKEVTLVGTVHDFQWTNPHSWIDLDVANDRGGVDTYGVELNSPNNLARQGWKSTSLKTGDHVSVTINPLRDGRKGGLFVSVKLPSGQVLGDPTRRVPNPQTAPDKPAAASPS